MNRPTLAAAYLANVARYVREGIDLHAQSRVEECATCNLIDGATSASVSRRHGTRVS